MVPCRVRIRFSKEGDLRLISHRDLVRTVERLFRRAGVALALSEGFHPKPRLSFPSALALGIAAADEVLEVKLAEDVDSHELSARLTQHAPPGMRICQVQVIPQGQPKLRVQSATYELSLPGERVHQAAAAIDHLQACEQFLIERSGRDEPFDLKSHLLDVHLADEHLSFSLLVNQQGSVRPQEVLQALNLADLPTSGCHLTRTAVKIAQ